jgi:hypothetical protein
MARRLNVVGPQVSKHRYAQELTQDMLVARCAAAGWDVSRQILAKIETQIRCVTDLEVVMLARALKVTIYDLYPANLIQKVGTGRPAK